MVPQILSPQMWEGWASDPFPRAGLTGPQHLAPPCGWGAAGDIFRAANPRPDLSPPFPVFFPQVLTSPQLPKAVELSQILPSCLAKPEPLTCLLAPRGQWRLTAYPWPAFQSPAYRASGHVPSVCESQALR